MSAKTLSHPDTVQATWSLDSLTASPTGLVRLKLKGQPVLNPVTRQQLAILVDGPGTERYAAVEARGARRTLDEYRQQQEQAKLTAAGKPGGPSPAQQAEQDAARRTALLEDVLELCRELHHFPGAQDPVQTDRDAIRQALGHPGRRWIVDQVRPYLEDWANFLPPPPAA